MLNRPQQLLLLLEHGIVLKFSNYLNHYSNYWQLIITADNVVLEGLRTRYKSLVLAYIPNIYRLIFAI